MTDKRLIELEERFAWLERHVREQDRSMLELGDELRRLTREIEALRGRLQAGAAGEEPAPPEEKPPHY